MCWGECVYSVHVHCCCDRRIELKFFVAYDSYRMPNRISARCFLPVRWCRCKNHIYNNPHRYGSELLYSGTWTHARTGIHLRYEKYSYEFLLWMNFSIWNCARQRKPIHTPLTSFCCFAFSTLFDVWITTKYEHDRIVQVNSCWDIHILLVLLFLISNSIKKFYSIGKSLGSIPKKNIWLKFGLI